jgi:amino acid transporter
MTELARRLGLFDATMIVMGGIVGAGIFINFRELTGNTASDGAIATLALGVSRWSTASACARGAISRASS